MVCHYRDFSFLRSITSILFFLLVGIWFWEPFGDQMIKWSICKPFLISDLLQASIFSSLFFCLKYLHHTFFYPEYFIIHSAKLKLEEKYVKQELTSQPYNTMESIVAETTLSQIPLWCEQTITTKNDDCYSSRGHESNETLNEYFNFHAIKRAKSERNSNSTNT